MAFDFTKAAGMGTDSLAQSAGMPFLTIIQKGSPEFDETHRKYPEKKFDGCRPGDVLFETERRLLPKPFLVIPLAQSTLYTEWKPAGGGLVGHRNLDITEHRDYHKGVPGTPTEFKEYLGQNELVFTMYYMVLFQLDNTWKKGIIAFTGKQLRHGRSWAKLILNQKMEGVQNLPIFAAKYSLNTGPESNEKGGWFGWRIVDAGLLSPEADQALLESAFNTSKQALLDLPRPQVAGALPSGEARVVPPDEQPY